MPGAERPAEPPPYRLPANPQLPRALRGRLVLDSARFAKQPPADLPTIVREHYHMDITGSFAGRPVRMPFGKGAGQLSMTVKEARTDAEAGLGFVVLKTVIAQDEGGRSTMADWAVHESMMDVGPLLSHAGRTGWSVSWKGRGWDRPFDDYLALYRDALAVGDAAGMPVAASVKYHLPVSGDAFQLSEYEYTTRKLAEIGGAGTIIEKDFSPTLAADERSAARETVLRWIREVPGIVKRQAPVTLGMKLMNALFDDDFQVEMLKAVTANAEVDYVTLFNRLWNPEKQAAYGGWDLSDRNLRVLDLAERRHGGTAEGGSGPIVPPFRRSAVPSFSATGNIGSGKMMVEYALRGATSGQIHTFFQLPKTEYIAERGSTTQRALHALIFHPEEGLIAWMAHLAETGGLEPRDGLLHFLDIADGPARHTS